MPKLKITGEGRLEIPLFARPFCMEVKRHFATDSKDSRI